MRRILMLGGVVGALLTAAPASAVDFQFLKSWNFCSGTSLNTFFNFELQQDQDDFEHFQLIMTFVSSEGVPEGVMTAAGLYQLGTGTGINIANASIWEAPEGNWTINSSGLTGGGQIEVVVAAGAQGNDGVGTGGYVTIRFTSDNLDEYLATLHARAHVQAFGENSCSLKPDSNIGVVDGVAEVDARCGTSTVPEPISLVLLGSGLLGIGGVGMRRRKRQV